MISVAIGDIDTALTYYKAALSLQQEKYGERHPYCACITAFIATCAMVCNQIDLAIQLFEESFQVYLDTYGTENHMVIAGGYNNAALMMSAMNQFEMAKKWLGKANDIFKELGITDVTRSM
eukprot:TRINITY_DN3270_c0_g2_i2.p1 TRINITY_DN3270_c0_g2~~TRINITY_DN3270_c0_g2_i2.p1  ORF type:complete len:121 (-),score=32.58 TRINITY_DN3270_c0_g2_i2:38-400(-)